MLGWMLKRGDNAQDAVDAADTTQVDLPDTPAPVFAARALKSALFGAPAPPNDQPQSKRAKVAPTKPTVLSDQVSDTPSKPQGILLTPGTGTSRRKRVSFGHDVPKTKPGLTSDALVAKDVETHRRTRLNEALEKARRNEPAKKTDARQANNDGSDSDWEEEDEDNCAHDITLDLNEPHSQSGRYWKEELQKYQKDAKVELDKMLKYKQLAKSYAQQKDTEANELAEMLKDEQQKVIKMEKKIAEKTSQIVNKSRTTTEETSPGSLAQLTKQTALSIQYRQRVKELEDQLEGLLREREDDPDSKGRRQRQTASPRTQKTLIETQRELRRARAQVKELGDLRDEVSSLKTQLRNAAKRAASKDADGQSSGNSRAQDLRAQLRQAKEEIKAKDDEIRQLKADFEAFTQESQVHEQDTRAVLERAHSKIADLKKEIKSIKIEAPDSSRPQSWHPQTQSVEPVKHEEPEVELPAVKSDAKTSRTTSRGFGQRKFEIADLEDEDASIEIQAPPGNSKSLRDKYQDKESSAAAFSRRTVSRGVPTVLGDRPNLEKPRWQPFVPRSPRNRAYLGDQVVSRLQNGGVTPLPTTKVEDAGIDDLSALAKTMARSRRDKPTEGDDLNVDLLQDRFVRLDGPEANINQKGKLPAKASKSTLPPERRAAALARIEQRLAEKKRAQKRVGLDKENVRP